MMNSNEKNYYLKRHYFTPSKQTVEHAIAAQDIHQHPRRLDITPDYTPSTDNPLYIPAVQENIGTRLLRITDFLKTTESAKRIEGRLIMTPDKNFTPEIQERLEKQLTLTPTRTSYTPFFTNLAQEFYTWLQSSPERCNLLGFKLDPTKGITLYHQRPKNPNTPRKKTFT